tara:strand:- start:557 stop:1015 length:459 start_codon:yes stop_codon:yes gene_type:complete
MLRIDNKVFKRVIKPMLIRLNWLFIIFIYLSVNGQVFATAIHICSEMALSTSVLSTSQNAVNIHEHHQKSMHHEDGQQKSMTHEMSKSKTMDNCQCVDCDCVQNITGQTNPSLVQYSVLTNYLPVVTTMLVMPEQNFISQPQTNPYRPPIIT